MPKSRENDFKEIIDFHYLGNMAMHQNKSPALYDIYISSLLIIKYYQYLLSWFDLCSRVEKKIFIEIHPFHTFYLKIMSPWSGIFNFIFSSLPSDASTNQIW